MKFSMEKSSQGWGDGLLSQVSAKQAWALEFGSLEPTQKSRPDSQSQSAAKATVRVTNRLTQQWALDAAMLTCQIRCAYW